MNTRQITYSPQEIKEILVKNLPQWAQISTSDIRLSKLTGLTNLTYKAEVVNQLISPQAVVFREFGNAEGFVDQKLEKLIFETISDLQLGPKQYNCGGPWRIEEFITQAIHPDNNLLSQPDFQFKCMGVMQRFHEMKINLPNQTTSAIVSAALSESMKLKVLKKINMTNLFNDEENKNLSQIQTIIKNLEEQTYLQSMVDKENHEELMFAHNDLNQLNIFKTETGDREVLFIDYEYCSYNYPSFDIANFLNESAINYLHTENPYYKLVEDNQFSTCQASFVAFCYELHRICNDEELKCIRTIINQIQNVSRDIYCFKQLQVQVFDLLSARLSAEAITQLKIQSKYRMRRIRRFMIISNLNWVYWSVLQAKNNSIDFNYIDYGMIRFQLYQKLLKQEQERD